MFLNTSVFIRNLHTNMLILFLFLRTKKKQCNKPEVRTVYGGNILLQNDKFGNIAAVYEVNRYLALGYRGWCHFSPIRTPARSAPVSCLTQQRDGTEMGAICLVLGHFQIQILGYDKLYVDPHL